MSRSLFVCLAITLTLLARAHGQPAQLAPEALAKIDEAAKQALARGDAPGVVIVVVHRGEVVYRKAFGQRSLQPDKTVMLPEIVFDMASLTKPIATATALMLLIEQGK